MKTFVKVKDNSRLDSLTDCKMYEVLSQFKTNTCGNGECIVVLNDNLLIQGYDIGFFE